MPLPPHGTLHCLVCIHTWQDHYSWKALGLGSNGSSLTLPLDRRYKVSHPSYCPPETCPLRTFPPMSASLCHSPSMLSLWHLWQNTSHSNSGDSSAKASKKRISCPLPLHCLCHHPPHPQKKTILSLHMSLHRLPIPYTPGQDDRQKKTTRGGNPSDFPRQSIHSLPLSHLLILGTLARGLPRIPPDTHSHPGYKSAMYSLQGTRTWIEGMP